MAFAEFYVMCMENYTPTTVGNVSERMRYFLSPGFWMDAGDALSKREELSRAGRVSSRFVLGASGESIVDRTEGLQVEVHGERSTFVSGEPANREHIVYRLHLSPSPPVRGNGFGLAVTAQEVRSMNESE
jgi:hypothetical protein